MAWRITRWTERMLDLAYWGITTLWGVFFLLDMMGYVVKLTPSVGIPMMAIWCPLLWWKYWRAKVAAERGAWFFLVLSVVLTGTTVVASFVILFRVFRSW